MLKQSICSPSSLLRAVLAAVLVAVSFGCASSTPGKSSETKASALWDKVGQYHRTISTQSKETQRLFDQGLLLCYSFDHASAIRLFERAAELDPKCAMAYWGIALAHGPHINNPAMTDEASKAAWDALAAARERMAGATPVERGLIDALAKRYVWPAPADRMPFEAAYADAMRAVWKAHPNDDDVGVLFAEALMDKRPWDLWTKDGKPQPETPEILEVLEAVLARTPDHPAGCHYYIHSMEASTTPERALAAADALCLRVPGSSHSVHMPSHIYIRTGQYLKSVEANQRATVVDQKRVARLGRGGFYAIYRAHNYHFLMWSAMFDGQSGLAMQAARDIVRELPPEVVAEMPQFLDGFMASPLHVMVRFGQWKEILAEPEPTATNMHGTSAFWRYARTLALSALGRVDEAAAQRQLFEQACLLVPDSHYMGNNKIATILEVARPMVEGELEYRRGNYDRAFELLRAAVACDDALKYDEPWGWPQPARHALGALLLEQGKTEEAEAVYREDLVRHPHNGWSLHGLAECLRKSGRADEAAKVEAELAEAWKRADVTIAASCYCRRGT